MSIFKKWFGTKPKLDSYTESKKDATPGETLGIFTFALSDVGCVRTGNEDNYYLTETNKDLPKGKGFLAIVADGMGGHAAGELASKLATEVISSEYFGSQRTAINQALFEAFVLANNEIFEQANADHGKKGMGTTSTAMVIKNNHLYFAHVGDSRLYRLRARELTQLSSDHTYVQELVRQGKISPKDAATHEDKHMLLQAMGTKPEVNIEVTQDALKIGSGDRYLMCSDGLYDLVSDKELKTMMENPSLEKTAKRMIETAKSRGGHDNITVVLVETLSRKDVEERNEMKTQEIIIAEKP